MPLVKALRGAERRSRSTINLSQQSHTIWSKDSSSWLSTSCLKTTRLSPTILPSLNACQNIRPSPLRCYEPSASTHRFHSTQHALNIEPFEYQPLQANEIRLLEILPGPEESMVSCHIEHHHIDNLPKYSALSYTWGTDPIRLPILVGGRLLQVTPNLHAALQEFRTRPIRHPDGDVVPRFQQLLLEISRRIVLLMSPGAASKEQLKVATAQIPLFVVQMKIGMTTVETILPLRLKSTEPGMSKGQQLELLKAEDDLENSISNMEELWSDTAFDPIVLAHENKRQFIWIDAICINQMDLQERTTQVMLMTKIYKRARALTVWLGAEDSSTKLAFSTLRRFANEISQSPQLQKQLESDPKNATYHFSLEEWASFTIIFMRPWFLRSWVVQEYALGGLSGVVPDFASGVASLTNGLYSLKYKVNCVTFCCGRQRMGDLITLGYFLLDSKKDDEQNAHFNRYWTEFMLIITSHRNSRTRSRLLAYRLLVDRKLLNVSDADSPIHNSLSMLLWTNSQAQATDPRDKVYSMLGIAAELDHISHPSYINDEIVIDYETPVTTVYASCVRSIISATKNLDILLFAYKERPSQITTSWVPDWTIPENSIPWLMPRKTAAMVSYTFNPTPPIEYKASFSTDLRALTVAGVVVGQIIWCSPSAEATPINLEMNRILPLPLGFLAHAHKLDKVNPQPQQAGQQILPAHQHHPFTSFVSLIIAHIQDQLAAMPVTPSQPTISTDNLWLLVMQLLSRERKGGSIKNPILEEDGSLAPPGEENPIFDMETTLKHVEPHLTQILNKSDIFLLEGETYPMGHARHGVKVGDLLVVLVGCKYPMILRPVVGGWYELVGDAYMPSDICKETMKGLKEGKGEVREFELR